MKKLSIIVLAIFTMFLIYKDYQLGQELQIIKVGIALVESDTELDWTEKRRRVAILQCNTAWKYDLLKRNFGLK